MYMINETQISLLVKLIWEKAFNSGMSKFCARQSLKNLKG